MEILPLDSSHGLDHVRLRRGRAVGGGIHRVADGGEWSSTPPLLNNGSGRLRGVESWKRKRAREAKKELGFDAYGYTRQLADISRGC